METRNYPDIVQGGMGVGISRWSLAKAVVSSGAIGVVSGTLIEVVMAWILQMGDAGGHIRRALGQFPIPEVAERVLKKYFLEKGKIIGQRLKRVPEFDLKPKNELIELTVCANFVEIFLAKEGHDGFIGLNLLEKLQLANIFALYGAMLAGVDGVFMGAGDVKQIPEVLDKLANHEQVSYVVEVMGAISEDDFRIWFDPVPFCRKKLPPLKRPDFFPVVASPITVKKLFSKTSGTIQGFVVETPLAGGHSARPRGEKTFDARGAPVYGKRDEINFEACVALGLPFWVGGASASPEKLAEAKLRGAYGIQVGSAFALCEESGMEKVYRNEIRRLAFRGELEIFADPRGSSTGLVFHVASLPGSLFFNDVYEARPRLCDIGRLRVPYKKENGTIGYRCPAEDVKAYDSKGGKEEDTIGRKCLCTGLLSMAGFPQRQKHGYLEVPIGTLGEDYSFVRHLMSHEEDSYTAGDVLRYLRREK
ncbi:MAG: nitronate monooxygenase [bacterium]|nr:nitronate monooxygenase [bacterium]